MLENNLAASVNPVRSWTCQSLGEFMLYKRCQLFEKLASFIYYCLSSPFFPGIEIFNLFLGEGIDADAHCRKLNACDFGIDFFRNSMNLVF